MRFLLLLLTLLVLAATVLYVLPGTIHVEKSMVLKAAPGQVYQSIHATGEWKNWVEWLKADPSNNITYNGPTAGPGARLNWSSEVADFGTGNVLIESAQLPSQVKATIQFDRYGTSGNTFLLENTGNGTRVTWITDVYVAEKSWLNKFKVFSWKKRIDAWMDASLKSLDERSAALPGMPLTGNARDSLASRLDSLQRRVDSLQKAKKDTVFVP